MTQQSDVLFNVPFGLLFKIYDIAGCNDGLRWYGMFLPLGHELHSLLIRSRGRARNVRRVGRPPNYSDRLAVTCATLWPDMKHVNIADKLGLPSYEPYESRQSDAVRHLVNRGQTLIKKYGKESDL